MFSRVQPHLKKCFEGIARLRFNEDLEVLAMRSTEGEEVELLEIISTAAARGQVEKWLVQLETEMRKSVHHAVHQAIIGYHIKKRTIWVLEWPGQTVLCVGQTYWTQQVEEAMLQGVNGLQRYLDQCQQELHDIILLIRGTLSKQNRITLGTVVFKQLFINGSFQKLDKLIESLFNRKCKKKILCNVILINFFRGASYSGCSQQGRSRRVISGGSNQKYRFQMVVSA